MTNYVISIGRQFCSGGRQVGKTVAEKLDIAFYDDAALRQEAKENGIEDGIFDMFDEQPTRSFLFSVVMDPYAIDSAVNEGKVLEAQRKIMAGAAQRGPCVIVGRRADKILERDYSVVSVFISADMNERVARFLERENMSEKAARRYIERKDRERAAYYNHMGDGKWGSADNYTMCFNTARMSGEEIADTIAAYVRKTFGEE